VFWDRHRVEQILTNMLSNAGKYGPGKPIEISAAFPSESVVIRVKDQGRGISDEDQKRIFDPFERVEDRGQTAGLGLGLYITSQIIAAHQGTIRVESQLGQGSTFIVELPVDANKGKS
jgi:signal transduction histidine kinase